MKNYHAWIFQFLCFVQKFNDCNAYFSADLDDVLIKIPATKPKNCKVHSRVQFQSFISSFRILIIEDGINNRFLQRMPLDLSILVSSLFSQQASIRASIFLLFRFAWALDYFVCFWFSLGDSQGCWIHHTRWCVQEACVSKTLQNF